MAPSPTAEDTRLADPLRALLHHEEGRVAITLLEEEIAGVDLAGVAPGGERLDVSVTQNGEGNIVIVGHVVLPRGFTVCP